MDVTLSRTKSSTGVEGGYVPQNSGFRRRRRTLRPALLGGLTLGMVRRGVSQAATLGYWMGQAHAGRGYMTSGVRLIAHYAFETLRLRRIEAACVPYNIASTKVLEKVGFQREGYARQYLCIDGAWQDHLLFALLRSEFPADTPSP